MLTFPPLNRQGAGPTERVALDFTDSRDVTRQEFKDDADVNIILDRFGVDSFAKRQPRYDEIDYNTDLQSALNTLITVQEGWDRLPDDIKARYPDWRTVVQLMAEGTPPKELLDALKPQPETPANGNATTSPEAQRNGETPTP